MRPARQIRIMFWVFFSSSFKEDTKEKQFSRQLELCAKMTLSQAVLHVLNIKGKALEELPRERHCYDFHEL